MRNLLAVGIVITVATLGLAVATPASAAPPEKVVMCKQKGGTWSPVLVNVSGVDKRLTRGDFLPGDPYPGTFPNTFVFGPNCEREQVPLDATGLSSVRTTCNDPSVGEFGEWSIEVSLTVVGVGFDSWEFVGRGGLPGQLVPALRLGPLTNEGPINVFPSPAQVFLEGNEIGQAGFDRVTARNPC